ncbi:hypothetical protein ACFYW8_09850 [Streptomyces sp. NPDC002742]|jgi:hypothetical protein|uniref:hypothetical protein n=1 Tax=unclassified Streptomyces TaxID=2593676 RepID=UPI003426AC12
MSDTNKDPVVKPQDQHATGEEAVVLDQHATDEELIALDQHATGGAIKPLDQHATTEPAN